ncbi:MAG: hypothetical protein WC966_06270 [Bradymonadales bacterium]
MKQYLKASDDYSMSSISPDSPKAFRYAPALAQLTDEQASMMREFSKRWDALYNNSAMFRSLAEVRRVSDETRLEAYEEMAVEYGAEVFESAYDDFLKHLNDMRRTHLWCNGIEELLFPRPSFMDIAYPRPPLLDFLWNEPPLKIVNSYMLQRGIVVSSLDDGILFLKTMHSLSSEHREMLLEHLQYWHHCRYVFDETPPTEQLMSNKKELEISFQAMYTKYGAEAFAAARDAFSKTNEKFYREMQTSDACGRVNPKIKYEDLALEGVFRSIDDWDFLLHSILKLSEEQQAIFIEFSEHWHKECRQLILALDLVPSRYDFAFALCRESKIRAMESMQAKCGAEKFDAFLDEFSKIYNARRESFKNSRWLYCIEEIIFPKTNLRILLRDLQSLEDFDTLIADDSIFFMKSMLSLSKVHRIILREFGKLWYREAMKRFIVHGRIKISEITEEATKKNRKDAMERAKEQLLASYGQKVFTDALDEFFKVNEKFFRDQTSADTYDHVELSKITCENLSENRCCFFFLNDRFRSTSPLFWLSDDQRAIFFEFAELWLDQCRKACLDQVIETADFELREECKIKAMEKMTTKYGENVFDVIRDTFKRKYSLRELG